MKIKNDMTRQEAFKVVRAIQNDRQAGVIPADIADAMMAMVIAKVVDERIQLESKKLEAAIERSCAQLIN